MKGAGPLARRLSGLLSERTNVSEDIPLSGHERAEGFSSAVRVRSL
jgi:hypothetical protein